MHRRLQRLQGGEAANEEGAVGLVGQGAEMDTNVYEQLKLNTFQKLYEFLQDYEHMKSKKSLKEALDAYGEKIMAIAESYQR